MLRLYLKVTFENNEQRAEFSMYHESCEKLFGKQLKEIVDPEHFNIEKEVNKLTQSNDMYTINAMAKYTPHITADGDNYYLSIRTLTKQS